MKPSINNAVLALVLPTSFLLLPVTARAQCEPAWLGGYFSGDGNIPPVVSQTWDPDGDGPQSPVVVVTGDVGTLGGARVKNIGAWDGAAWSNLAGGLNDQAYGLTTWDPDGAGPDQPLLVVGGSFTTAGEISALHIAAWDGASWRAFGDGLPGAVVGLTSHDADGPGPEPARLYATSQEPGQAGGRVYRWDGSAWTSIVSTISTSFLRSLVSYDRDGAGPALPVLVAAGIFDSIDGVTANSIAAWDGTTWSPIGTGVATGGAITTMTVYDPDDAGPSVPLLTVGGQFTSVGGSLSSGLAAWNGTSWQGLGVGLYPALMWVNEIDVVDPDGTGGALPRLAIAGQYIIAGGSFAPALATWDGSSFETAPFPLPGGWGTIGTVANWSDGQGGPGVFTCGFYQVTATISNKFTTWDGDGLHYIGTGPEGVTRALTRFSVPGIAGPVDPPLIAAGDYKYIGDDLSSGLAVWDGRTWEPLPGGWVNGSSVYALGSGTISGAPVLIAGGTFSAIGSVPLANIGRFDGTTWSALGAGFNGSVRAVLVADPDGPGPIGAVPIAGGAFTTSGGPLRARIAYWNGTSWQPFDFGFADGTVTCLTIADVDGAGPLPPSLVAGGSFLSAAGVSTSRVAYWNGSSWRPLGTGFDGTVNAVRAFDVDGAGPMGPALVAAGLFGTPGGPDLNGAAYWNGSAWVKLGLSAVVHGATALTSYTPVEGGPDVLVAVGAFPTGAALFDGTDWVTMGAGVFSGTTPSVYAALTFDPDGSGPSGPLVTIGGNFNTVGGLTSVSVARWATHPAPWIITNPQDTSDDPAVFTAEPALGYAELPAGLAYQWTRNGVPVTDGPGGASPGGGVVSGASGILTTSGPVTLVIDEPTPSDAGNYACTFSNGCGSATTTSARLGSPCPIDYTGDGIIDFSDYLEFLNLFDAQDPAADLNHDGMIDFADYLEFLNLFDSGC